MDDTRRAIDLNADLGEGFGRWTLGPDDELLEVITSANVACGFHAGDPTIIRRVCAVAAQRGVRVGAQVSYRDLAGFGRRSMDVPSLELRDEVLYQLAALDGICRVVGTSVSYVKPHGALYNRCFSDAAQASAVVAAVVEFNPALSLLGQPGSALHRAGAEVGLRTVNEAFADRAYAADGSLVPRTQSGSVIHASDEVVHRVLQLATGGTIAAVDGSVLELDAASVCIHSDTPGAADLARSIRRGLHAAGISTAPFV
ncbi:MAG: LamB/YcsF family protein [Actinomycetota bacterium]|nr:LamB/YcsF family protein [Actinomycetota bacterium]